MGHLYYARVVLSFWLNLGMADLYPWMFDDAHDASILISFSGNWCRDVFVGLFVLVWHVRAATVQIWPFCGLKSDPTASLIPRPLLARIQSTFPVFHQLVPIFQLNYPLLSNIPSASPIICMSLGYSRKCYSHPFSSCSIFQHLKSSRPAKKSPPFSPIFFWREAKGAWQLLRCFQDPGGTGGVRLRGQRDAKRRGRIPMVWCCVSTNAIQNTSILGMVYTTPPIAIHLWWFWGCFIFG